MKKIIILLLILALFSCKDKNSNKKSILYQHYFTGSLSTGTDDLTMFINKSQKDYTLISTPLEHEEFKVTIRTQLDGENPPDIFSYWAGSRTKYLLDNNKISPITNLFNSDNIKNFDPSIIDACSYNGEIYLLPITRHYVGFFYNIEIFDKLNIDVPKTWEDLITISAKLKANGVNPFALGAKNRWPAQFWFDYILLRTAGFKYRERLMIDEASYNDPEVILALKLWKELIDLGFFGSDSLEQDWDSAILDISNQKSAMTLMGTWTIPLLESEGLKPVVDYGFFRFPIIDPNIEITSLGPIDGVLMAEASKNREIDLMVLKQLLLVENQEIFNQNSGAIAPHLLVNDEIYNPIQIQIKDYIKESENWAFNYDLATKPIISEAGLNFFADFLKTPNRYLELLDKLEEYKLENK